MLILGALALALAGTLPEVDKPLKTGARNSEDAAVVIGIEDYIFVADVPYATRDAQAVYDFLIYTRGVPSSQVRLLNGGASRELILEAVTKAGKQVSQNGVVWVYFAGHGAADPSTGDRILLGDDVRNDPVAFASRALTVDELLSFGGAGGGRVHLLVDACYSGLGRSGEAVLAGKRFAVPNYAVQGSRHLLWSASSGDQLSGPLEAVQHGAFTYTMLGALRGWADGELDGVRDGRVTAEEAQLYVSSALRSLQITGQQPELVVEGDVVMMESSRLESAPELTASATAPTRPGFANPKDEKMVAPWDGMNLPTGLGEVIYCDDTALNVKYNFDVIVRQEALAELYTGAIEKQGWTKDIESIDSSNDVAVNFKKNGQTLVLSAAFQQFDRKFLVSMVLLDF